MTKKQAEDIAAEALRAFLLCTISNMAEGGDLQQSIDGYSERDQIKIAEAMKRCADRLVRRKKVAP